MRRGSRGVAVFKRSLGLEVIQGIGLRLVCAFCVQDGGFWSYRMQV
jgi:hypothetical protein